MRSSLIYGIIIISCIIITTVQADRKWKNYDNEEVKCSKKDASGNKEKKEKYFKNKGDKVIDIEDRERSNGQNNKNAIDKDISSFSKSKSPVKRKDDDMSSEEKYFPKNKNKNKNEENQQAPKKFIGRIEHGKVMVLRRKEESYKNQNNDNSDESEEDHKEKVCRKTKGGKKDDCNDDNSDLDGEEENIPKKKIKYSIKFQHEKLKKKENSGDSSILRLHKNGKRYGKYDDDDDASDEDDSPVIKKRINYVDDEEY